MNNVSHPAKLEGVVKVVSSLQSGSNHQKYLSNLFVNLLWKQLQHPPMTYLGMLFDLSPLKTR